MQPNAHTYKNAAARYLDWAAEALSAQDWQLGLAYLKRALSMANKSQGLVSAGRILVAIRRTHERIKAK
jgi:hypothetical protein